MFAGAGPHASPHRHRCYTTGHLIFASDLESVLYDKDSGPSGADIPTSIIQAGAGLEIRPMLLFHAAQAAAQTGVTGGM